jgi:hypothetical protein
MALLGDVWCVVFEWVHDTQYMYIIVKQLFVLWFALLGLMNFLYLWIYLKLEISWWFSCDQIFHLLLFSDVAGWRTGEQLKHNTPNIL